MNLGCDQRNNTINRNQTTQTNETKEEEIKVATPINDRSEMIVQDVPFTAQAPTRNWDDERQAEGCEEASALMAMMWINNYTLSKSKAEKEIIKIADFETLEYGNHIHSSAEDTAQRILEGYFKYDKHKIIEDFTKEDLIDQLYENKIIIIPTDGIALANPYFTSPPEHHMLVIIGYDPNKKEFITNDPGTRKGEKYRYDENHLFDAIKNYNSNGKNENLAEKTAILISK